MNTWEKHSHQATAAGGLIVLLSLAGWACLQRPRLERWTRPVPKVSGADYQPARFDLALEPARPWPEPKGQSRGPEWIYDVFTPPPIYYDAASGAFTVNLPRPPEPPVAPPEPPFGVELTEIKLNLFRLQLVGFVGSATHLRGMFINLDTSDTLLLGEGQDVPGADLRVETLKVEKVQVPTPESMPLTEPTGFATVLDQRTGETVVLNSRERRVQSAPQAVLLDPAGGERMSLRAGESVTLASGTFTIQSIDSESGSVAVAKIAPGATEESTKTLTIGSADQNAPADGTESASASATPAAANDSFFSHP